MFTNSKLGLHLSPQQLAITGSELKGVRLLGYDRQSIAQILYLDRQTGPMALCITRADNAQVTEPDSEVRYGMNVAYWRQQGFNYMLIGHKTPQALHELARQMMDS
nr:hypothetical protein [Pantoea sp. 201603H]